VLLQTDPLTHQLRRSHTNCSRCVNTAIGVRLHDDRLWCGDGCNRCELRRRLSRRLRLVAQESPAPLPRDIAQQRQALLEEEVGEVAAAVQGGRLEEIAHELADVVYVVHGTALAYGVDLDSVPPVRSTCSLDSARVEVAGLAEVPIPGVACEGMTHKGANSRSTRPGGRVIARTGT
jgi:hypothetical protein